MGLFLLYRIDYPKKTPKIIANIIEAKPTIRDILEPYIIVENISLPC